MIKSHLKLILLAISLVFFQIQTISSTIFTPEINLTRGNYSKYRPDQVDKIDIKKSLRDIDGLTSFLINDIEMNEKRVQNSLKKCISSV